MTGSWTGTSADTSGQERMSWTITQDSGAMSGTVNVSDASRGMAGSGSVRGNVNGRTASFHMDVPTGGFGGMMSSCAMSMDGQATMSDDGHTLTGTYAGTMAGSMMSSGGMMTQSCGGAMANGQFTLTR